MSNLESIYGKLQSPCRTTEAWHVPVLFNSKHHSKSCNYRYINTHLCTCSTTSTEFCKALLLSWVCPWATQLPHAKPTDAVQACMLCMPLPYIVLSTNRTRLVTPFCCCPPESWIHANSSPGGTIYLGLHRSENNITRGIVRDPGYLRMQLSATFICCLAS